MIAHCFTVNDAFEDVPQKGDKALCGWPLPSDFEDAALTDPKCPECVKAINQALSEHKWHQAS